MSRPLTFADNGEEGLPSKKSNGTAKCHYVVIVIRHCERVKTTMPGRLPRRIGILDLFSGCGGASLGFRLAAEKHENVQILGGVDIDTYSCASYERIVGRPCLCLDLAAVADSSALFASMSRDLKINDVDDLIVIGCSPCQGFAAHRASHNGLDARRDLFEVLCSLILRLQPAAFFLENVPDLVSRKHWKWFDAGISSLTGDGYSTHTEIYNFAELGLPQERFRVTIVGSKTGEINLAIPRRPHDSFHTVKDAIGHLPPLKAGESSRNDPMHKTSAHRTSTINILRRVPKDGGSRPTGIGPACLDRARAMHGGYTDVYGRLRWNRPSVTITSRCRTPSCGRFAHPEQNRGLTPREAANLQGFPEDVMLEGPFDDLFKQIGNAVSPAIAQQFATQIIKHVLDNAYKPIDEHGVRSGVLKSVGPGFAVKINGLKLGRQRTNAGV